MRHAALAVLLALPVSAFAGSADADFGAQLGEVMTQLRHDGAAPIFTPYDWVKPQRRPGLEQLDREQADLFQRTVPATFIVRTGVRGQRGSGTGSGYFINPDGTGMTNVHVVGSRVGTIVELETARGVKHARVLAVAPGRDIAIIKVSDDNFADWDALVMGTQLAAGNNVFAIGNPVDQGITFTRGIVSRPVQEKASPWLDVLQLDIELNPGNSGGALVDSSGRLAGMNQAILRGGAVNGIGFAIPVQELARAQQEFASTGKLEDGVTHIGVAGDDLMVVSVPAGPAANAGLRVGDAIVSFPGSQNAVAGNKPNALMRAVGRSRPGTTVPIQVVHGTACTVHTSATAGARPVASVPCVINQTTGKLIIAGSPALLAFLQAVTEQSVEEVEVNGTRYAVAAEGQPNPVTGFMMSAATLPKKALTPVAINLPVELYEGQEEEAAVAGPVAPSHP